MKPLLIFAGIFMMCNMPMVAGFFILLHGAFSE